MRNTLFLAACAALLLTAGCMSGQPSGNDTPVEGPANQTNDTTEPASFCGWSTNASCTSDADCKRTGCSGQVCGAEDVTTTCEYRECYDAEAFGVNCGCVNGQCQWRK